MVGINASKGFTLLQDIDQFALCGFSPQTKLNFDELLKQAIRVLALLHDDKLLPRTDPAIWQAPKTRMPTPLATPPPPRRKRGRRGADDGEPAVPERKRRAYAYSGKDSSPKEDTCHTTSSTHSEPKEEFPSHSAAAAEMSLIQLLRLARDPTRHRVAVASLPQRENRIVTMGFDKSHGVRYRVENVNIEGDTLFGTHFCPTYRSLKKQGAVFLGRFADASQGELLEFALELYKDVPPNAGLPLRDRSPSRKASS